MSLPKIEVPTFKVIVPSNQQELTMRCMKVKEEKILLMAKEGADYGEILAAVKQVVNNCVIEPVVAIDELAIFDIEYLFLKLRSKSVSETTEVSYIDNDEVATALDGVDTNSATYARMKDTEQRKATYTFTIDLNKVEMKFPDKLDKKIKVDDKIGITLSFPPASLYSDKEFMNTEGENLVDLLILKSIETIYNGPTIAYNKATKVKTEELKEFLENLDVKSYNKIREFFNNLPHLHYEIKYTNKNGKDRTIVLTTLNDFFMLA